MKNSQQKKIKPKYPIYVTSYSREETCYTANFLIADSIPFYLVIQPQQYKQYQKKYPDANYLILPKYIKNVMTTRNWIKDHSIKNGDKRHWQLDDNIRGVYILYKSERINCNSNLAFGITEDFVDRYENIAIAGLNYDKFIIPKNVKIPFYLNCHVYSFTLILNAIPYKWRLRYNEDTDMCLQVLAGGWCTIAMNIFSAKKMGTMTVKGGNTNMLYEGDGRLKMSRMLERSWPGVVTTVRKFQRPQHSIKNQWASFDNKLIKRKDIDWDEIKKNKYNIGLMQTQEIKSKSLQKFYDEHRTKD